ncbi:MAG: MlaD family protein [bacterium]
MSRKKKISSSFLIGAFVLIGVFILIGTVVWLGQTQFMQKTAYYVTYFDGSVEGLEKGSPVKYLGVPIGSVDKIGVAPDGKLVEVIMQIDSKIQIDRKLRIKAEYAGLAGGKFLQLSYPTNPEILDAFPAMSFVPSYKLIKSSPSGIEEIEIAMREVMNNLRLLKVAEISEETVRFLNSASSFFENKELHSTITKFNESAKHLENILMNAEQSNFIANIESTSYKLLQSSEQLVTFGEKLNKEVETMMLTSKVDYAFAQFDTTMNHTKRIINVLGFRGEEVMFSLNETLMELQATNKQLKKTLKAYTENPGHLLFAEPPKEEK